MFDEEMKRAQPASRDDYQQSSFAKLFRRFTSSTRATSVFFLCWIIAFVVGPLLLESLDIITPESAVAVGMCGGVLGLYTLWVVGVCYEATLDHEEWLRRR